MQGCSSLAADYDWELESSHRACKLLSYSTNTGDSRPWSSPAAHTRYGHWVLNTDVATTIAEAAKTRLVVPLCGFRTLQQQGLRPHILVRQ